MNGPRGQAEGGLRTHVLRACRGVVGDVFTLQARVGGMCNSLSESCHLRRR